MKKHSVEQRGNASSAALTGHPQSTHCFRWPRGMFKIIPTFQGRHGCGVLDFYTIYLVRKYKWFPCTLLRGKKKSNICSDYTALFSMVRAYIFWSGCVRSTISKCTRCTFAWLGGGTKCYTFLEEYFYLKRNSWCCEYINTNVFGYNVCNRNRLLNGWVPLK